MFLTLGHSLESLQGIVIRLARRDKESLVRPSFPDVRRLATHKIRHLHDLLRRVPFIRLAAPIVISLAASPSSAQGLFDAAVHYSISCSPTGLAAGDFDEDGHPDLAVTVNTDCGLNPIQIALNNGSGAFDPATPASTDTGNALRVAVADMNADGHADLVYTGGNKLNVCLGVGDGSFLPAIMTSANGGYSLGIGDFNGDGELDVAVVAYVPRVLLIYSGRGDGAFDPSPGSYPLSGDGEGVAVGDLNADGMADLVVGLSGRLCTQPALSIFMGQGDGSFTTAVGPAIPTGASPRTPVISDFNGDGVPDIAANNTCASSVSVILGNGGGSFPGGTNYPVGLHPTELACTDLNGDGILDFAATGFSEGRVSVLLGTAGGGFGSEGQYVVSPMIRGLIAVDLDSDCKPDLVAGGVDVLSNTSPSPGCRQPVVLAPASQSGLEGVLLQFNITASDPDGVAITSLTASGSAMTSGASFTPGPGNTSGTFSWTPTCGQAGAYSVTFTAANALAGSASTFIDIGPSFSIASAIFDKSQYAANEVARLTVTLQSQSFDGSVDVSPALNLRFGPPVTLGTDSAMLVPGETTSVPFDWTVPTVEGQALIDVAVTASGNGCGAQRTVPGTAVANQLTTDAIQLAHQQMDNCGTTTTQSCVDGGSLVSLIRGALPFVGTLDGLNSTVSDHCLAEQYWNAGRHTQSLVMGLVTGVDAVRDAISIAGDVTCAALGIGCIPRSVLEVIPDGLSVVVTCVTALFDQPTANQTRQMSPSPTMVSDSLMGWLPDSLQLAFTESGHTLANLAVCSGSSLLRIEADSAFTTADSVGHSGVLVLRLGGRPVQFSAVRSGATRPHNAGANPTDAVTLRLEASTRDTCRVVLFHRGSDGTVARLVYGPALLEAGGTATLHTSQDSTSFAFAIDQNGDGVEDWLLYPRGSVTGISSDEPTRNSRATVRVLRIAPNPSVGSAKMFMRVSGTAVPARLVIYDVAGRLVADENLAMLTRGDQVISWDWRNVKGGRVASGIYFVRVTYPGGSSAPSRFVLLR